VVLKKDGHQLDPSSGEYRGFTFSQNQEQMEGIHLRITRIGETNEDGVEWRRLQGGDQDPEGAGSAIDG
jgi:hypothetical protein